MGRKEVHHCQAPSASWSLAQVSAASGDGASISCRTASGLGVRGIGKLDGAVCYWGILRLVVQTVVLSPKIKPQIGGGGGD